jgi:hypothetical protein
MSAIRLAADAALDAAFYEAVGRCNTSWADIGASGSRFY